MEPRTTASVTQRRDGIDQPDKHTLSVSSRCPCIQRRRQRPVRIACAARGVFLARLHQALATCLAPGAPPSASIGVDSADSSKAVAILLPPMTMGALQFTSASDSGI